MEEKFKTESGKWDLERITKECVKELRKIRIPIRNVMEVRVIKNSYAACRVDQCHFGNGWFDLCISKAYQNPTMDLQEIKTAVCHLLLHTVRGCMNHDEKWMEYAEKTDRIYGLHTAEYAGSAMDASVPDKEKCCFLEHLAKLEVLMGECSEELKGIGINVGRPILTACVDAYSGMCCGYSLSWEGGVYSLRNLMFNVITDKVEYCRSFGIEIDRQDWNCNRLMGKLVTDMGSEYKSQNFEQITDLGVQLINLPSYRPELKSKVEKFFDCIQGYYKNQLKGKGVVEPNFQERGAPDYRKDACLTMADFEKIIIYCIMFYNSKRVLENFPYSEEMLAQGVKPYASEIWNYGCNQEGCNLISVGREQLILTLLPRATGKFTRHGLAVNGMHYHNINYREQYLNGKECVVAYNPDDVCKVWLVERGVYTGFDLIESRFRDKDLTGVGDMKQRQREIVRQELGNKTQAEIDLARHISVLSGASGGQKKPSTKNIRSNRKKEQERAHRDLGKEVG